MRILIALLLTFSTLSIAGELQSSWTDPSGLVWAQGKSVRTTHEGAAQSCRAIGFVLPTAAEFFEAVDSGLLDRKVNTAFDGHRVDWIWLHYTPDGLSFRPIAWRYEEVTRVPGYYRHWALCVRR